MTGKAQKVTGCCWIFGLLVLILGLVLIPVFHNVIHALVKEKIPLKKGSSTYGDWTKPPIPVFFQAFVFHLANHDEVIQNGDKPVMIQKGPYTYREHRKKVNVTAIDSNSTLTYREIRYYSFERGMSVGPEEDIFVTVNIPMVAIASLLRFEYGAVQEFANLILELAGEHLFIPLSVGDILWGYEDPLLKKGKELLAKFNISAPFDDRFGLFYKQNGSDDGWYNIYSGVGNVSKFGMINSWNYNHNLDVWTTPASNCINGTDGTIFPPFVTSDDVLYLFSSDICRSVYVVYERDTSIHGIPLLRFAAPPAMFANVSTNPANAGFCTPAGNCLPSGVLNASVCRDGAPVILSQPNFLAAAPSIVNGVWGMAPNKEEHETFIEIEPITGVAMNVAKRLQLNLYLENISHIIETEKLHSMIYPILWINESATIDEKSANAFKSEVQLAIKITEAVQYGLISLGIFVLICTTTYGIKFFTEKCGKKEERDFPDETSPLVQD